MSNGVLALFAGLDRTRPGGARALVTLLAGLDRTRPGGARALVTLLAAASMIWALLGPAALTVDAAGPGSGAAAGQHPCGHGSGDQSSQDGHRCCRCCGHPVPPPAPVETPAPTTPPAPPRQPAPTPARTVTVGNPQSRATPSPHLVVPSPQMPAGSRSPVLAPPALTVPSGPQAVVVATSPVSLYVITLSALLVAGAIAAATIVFVRRSD